MSSVQQKSALKKLLTQRSEKETIYDILGRMEALGVFLRENKAYKNLLPFHETYHLVTKKIADTYVEFPHFFASRKDLELLDINFAYLYFQPLYAYITEGAKHTPWQTFFTYCEQPHGTSFVQMLLGINAHINADLATALEQTSYHEEQDFLRINDILLLEIPNVMRYLAFADHDFFAISGMIFLKKYMVDEFQKIVVSWRKNAWANYQKKRNSHEIALDTESLGKSIIYTFDHLISESGIQGVTQKINQLAIAT